jgi:hypothetical protein
MRALALSVAVAAGIAAGCGVLPPTPDPMTAASFSVSQDGQRTTLVVDPWPLDDSVAFLCLRAPGAEFTAATPVPAPEAGCTRLRTSAADGRLTAEFDPRTADPAVVQAFATSSPPWFFAVAGRRGPLRFERVIPLEASPVPSDAGPS